MTPTAQVIAFTQTWQSIVLSGVTHTDKFIWLQDMKRSNTEQFAASLHVKQIITITMQSKIQT
jgi:hypothetical protein